MAQMGNLALGLLWQLRHWGVAAVPFMFPARFCSGATHCGRRINLI